MAKKEQAFRKYSPEFKLSVIPDMRENFTKRENYIKITKLISRNVSTIPPHITVYFPII